MSGCAVSNINDQLGRLIRPDSLYKPSTVLQSLDAQIFGVYGWWFRRGSLPVPTAGTAECTEGCLLYVGIAPVNASSKSDLRNRLGNHIANDASRSTLRKALGCLLAEPLKLSFRVTRTSNEGRTLYYGLGEGEARLSAWMEKHATISWIEHPQPWLLEPDALRMLTLPLNVSGNEHCKFSSVLHEMRTRQFAVAANLHRGSRAG